MDDKKSYDAAFSGYLGTDEAAWKAYDATELMKTYSGPPIHILIDTGTADNFLKVITLLVFIGVYVLVCMQYTCNCICLSRSGGTFHGQCTAE